MNEDIERMTDSELVEAVASEVMGWTTIHCDNGVNWFDRQTAGKKFPVFVLYKEGTALYQSKDWTFKSDYWSPMDEWNDTMQVVAAMRAKGLKFCINEYTDERCGFVTFHNHDIDVEEAFDVTGDGERRAILRAALRSAREASQLQSPARLR